MSFDVKCRQCDDIVPVRRTKSGRLMFAHGECIARLTKKDRAEIRAWFRALEAPAS